ncbi:MAG: elongation factor P [Chloroflexi bacterium]|nr:elongation factor P [Chloroflexota bacterium]
MIDTSELRRGLMVKLEGQLYQVVEYQPFRHAQRAAMVRVKLKNMRTGRTQERTLQPGDKLYRAEMEMKAVQFLYREDDLWYFMDTANFEQFPLGAEVLGEASGYLAEGLTMQLMFFEGQPLTVELPITVELKIKDTGPAFKGDTAQSGTKPATLDTGLIIKVPLYISQGEMVRVDTRTGEFVERVT